MKEDNSAERVVQHLRRRVSASSVGERLPSVREMMSELGVSPLTVRRAVKQLVAAGLIDARPGNGTFVADRRAPPAAGDFGWQSLALGAADVNDEALRALLAAPSPGAVNLGGGYLPDELQALPQLSAAMARVARRPGVWGRMPSQGVGPLRMWFAQQIGGGIGAHDVIVSPGSQAAISVVLRALVAPGASLLVESPTYVGAIIVARALRLPLVPVTTDAGGVVPEALAAAFERTGARVFYSQPTFANPSGATLAEARRAEVLDVVAKAGAFLVEDDWGRDFAIDAVPLPPLATADANGHVVYLRSLTKSAAPGLRIGAIVAKGAALARLLSARTIADFFIAGPIQEAALELVTSPAWPRHLKSLRGGLRARRDALVGALRAELGPGSLPLVPGGGLHLWTRLPDRVVDVDIAARAHAAGVIVSAGRQWFPAEPTGSFLRLSFATAPPDAMAGAVATLARLVRA
ncbi:MAG TPA: PLP-dependent aminotransferase family protein [Pseudomonadales bacterium]|nr:PLP-dependent aminotransferase family protein [Pseudomonadales bacterium]